MAGLGSFLLKKIATAPKLAGSTEGLNSSPAISASLNDAIQQEAVYHLVMMSILEMAKTSAQDQVIVSTCLTGVSTMLDRGDCSVATFTRIQNELPGRIRSLRTPTARVSETMHTTAMDIADRVLTTHTVGYNASEAQLVTDYLKTRGECEKKAEAIITLVGTRVKTLIPSLLHKYPFLFKDAAASPFSV